MVVEAWSWLQWSLVVAHWNISWLLFFFFLFEMSPNRWRRTQGSVFRIRVWVALFWKQLLNWQIPRCSRNDLPLHSPPYLRQTFSFNGGDFKSLTKKWTQQVYYSNSTLHFSFLLFHSSEFPLSVPAASTSPSVTGAVRGMEHSQSLWDEVRVPWNEEFHWIGSRWLTVFFSCPLLVWYSLEIQLLLELPEIEE